MALVTHQSYGALLRSTAACTVPSARPSDHAVTNAMSGTSRLPGKWRRLLVIALTGGGVAMIPWLALLGCSLPRTATVAHWNVAWVGLDALEAIGLFATGRLLARRDRRYAVTAALTGTVLLVDAWFDTLTSASRSELLVAIAMAGAIELPLSCLCFSLAWRAVPGPNHPLP
jgi:hypothetical protein